MNDIKCLASYALFRELYEKGQNIYTVLSEFLKYLIVHENLITFNLTEIRMKLNDYFHFQIPDAVVKKALKTLSKEKLIVKDSGKYVRCDKAKDAISSDLTKSFNNVEMEQKTIWDNLIAYIEINEKCNLDKDQLIKSFCSFVLGKGSGNKYSEHISAFIIKNENDDSFIKELKRIKEGVILYTGLQFNLHADNISSWNTGLTIYLDTEILFYYSGYNGDLYKQLFDDFLGLVQEINNKSLSRNQDKRIHLKYFEDTQKEIEAFFKKAEDLLDHKIIIDPSKTAMVEILQDCKGKADVSEKNILFFEKLKRDDILCDDCSNYYDDANKEFNIIDRILIQKICADKEFSENFENGSYRDITESSLLRVLRPLNRINILRKGVSNIGLENIKWIFLTAKRMSRALAWHRELRGDDDIPLVTSLDFMTDKLWFKLNKGFGGAEYPVAFNIITRAKMVLSARLSESISCQYDNVIKKSETKELNHTEMVACLSNLRQKAKKPEDLFSEFDVDSALQTINEDDIEVYTRETSFLKSRVETFDSKNKELEDNLKKKQDELEQKEEKLNHYKRQEVERLEKEKEILRKRKIVKQYILRFSMISLLVGVLVLAFIYKILLGILTLIGAFGGIVFLRKWYFQLENRILK